MGNCDAHGDKVIVRDAAPGSATAVTFCAKCGRYYGRVPLDAIHRLKQKGLVERDERGAK